MANRDVSASNPRLYPSFPIPAVSALIMHKENVLLIKRAASPGKGLWALPGGVVELGEDLKAALIREVKEETGLLVDVGDVFSVSQYVEIDNAGRTRYHYVILTFLCRVAGEPLTVPKTDAAEVAWFDVSNALKLKLTETTRLVLSKLHDHTNEIYLGTSVSRVCM